MQTCFTVLARGKRGKVMLTKASVTKIRFKGIIVLLCLAIPMILSFSACKPKEPPEPAPVSKQEPPEIEIPLSPITGMPLEAEGSPVAVSIGNNQSARPQSGLSEADVVYEVQAEGGITRYLAIYHSKAPKTVGPIRSARPYLVMLAKEWGAVFAHCGGDPKDLEPIRDWQVADADEFHRGDLFWRGTSRVPPDNLYASIETLREAVSAPLESPQKRYEFADWAEEPVSGIRIDYGYNYKVEYRYQPELEGYTRYVIDGGTERQQVDLDTQDEILASNILIQVVSSKIVYSDGGLVIDLIGQGSAQYLTGGTWHQGVWQKESVQGATMFLGEDDRPIELAPGQTWIQIIPKTATVSLLDE